MKVLAKIGLALGLATLTVSGAAAQPFTPYGSAAGWTIVSNDRMGPGCLMYQTLADGSQVQMGIDASATPARGFLALYTEQHSDTAPGATRSVSFEVGGKTYTGEAKGQSMAGFDGAFVWVNNRDFIWDLAKMDSMKVTGEGHEPIVVSLKGTDDAFKSLRACQDEKKKI